MDCGGERVKKDRVKSIWNVILFHVFFLSLKIILFWRMRTYLHKKNIGNNTCDASRDKKRGVPGRIRRVQLQTTKRNRAV